jgi:hypothetical protein
MGCAYVVMLIARTGDSRLWIFFGILAGLGIQNKHSTLLFGLAVVIGLLVSPQRREVLKPWLWAGGAAAFLIFLPNLIWQVRHGFPTLEDLRNVQEMGKNIVLSPGEFLAQQVLLLHPLFLPVWLAGLVSLIAGKGRRMQALGWAYLALLAIMIVLKAKNYYLAPIYPMLFAAGAVSLEDWLDRRAWAGGRLWPKTALLILASLVAAVTVPAMVPILPPGGLVSYQRALGVGVPRTEVHHSGPLPQIFGDQFGWEQLVKEVARIYWSLPSEERARTGIFASNYGEAGALNLFGPAYKLPPAICAHQTHYFWGPGDFEGTTLIWLQWGRESLQRVCGSVDQVGEHFHPWGMGEENRPIYLCRDLRAPLRTIWPRLKNWN